MLPHWNIHSSPWTNGQNFYLLNRTTTIMQQEEYSLLKRACVLYIQKIKNDGKKANPNTEYKLKPMSLTVLN